MHNSANSDGSNHGSPEAALHLLNRINGSRNSLRRYMFFLHFHNNTMNSHLCNHIAEIVWNLMMVLYVCRVARMG
ncbi:hypothetical protein M758_7G126100 [Ceratodon purpureus]|nr:hypothetical protein M758_7G126100 [Ceratodon purpureus]